jgi:hydrogenase-4 component B
MAQLGFLLCLTGLIVAPVISAITPRSIRGQRPDAVIILCSLLVGAAVGASALWRGDPVGLDLSSFAPFALALKVDLLSAFFLFLICTVAAPVTLFSVPYARQHYQDSRETWFWVFLPLFVLSMVAVVTAATGFVFLFGWELMTLLSAALILLEGDSEDRRHNVFIYLLMMHAGAAAVAACFFLFLGHASSLTFEAMRAAAGSLPAAVRVWVFFTAMLGFGMKAGIVPLHLWLPRAHPIAPTPVSALMSGVMLKTAVYGFVRVTFDLLGNPASWWGYAVLLIGAVTALLGILYALGEHDLKRLLAYSSVENIGLIYLALGAAMVFAANSLPTLAALAIIAALLHALNHALFKSLLFLSAGAIHHSTHTLDIEHLGGLLRRMPVVGVSCLVGCCAIAGLPVFNGFVGEWLMFKALLAGGELNAIGGVPVLPLMIGVVGLVSGLSAACFVKFYGISFLGRPRTVEAEYPDEVTPAMKTALVLLAIGCVLLGVWPVLVLSPLLSLAAVIIPGAGVPGDLQLISHILPVIAGFVVAVLLAGFSLPRLKRFVDTWACGLPELSPRMEYTATSFSKPIRSVFAFVYKPDRKIAVTPVDQVYFPQAMSYRSERTTSFEKSLYRPVVNSVVAAAQQLRRLQTGNVQVYLLYIFLTLVFLLVVLRFSR